MLSAIFNTSTVFGSMNVTTAGLYQVAQLDLTQYQGAFRITSLAVRISLAAAIRFDTLKLVLQSPVGDEILLMENCCFGCINGLLSLEFSNDAMRPLPKQLCASGIFSPLVGSLNADNLNTPSSFGKWLLLASASANTTFVVINGSFELGLAQISMSVGSTVCSQMMWIADSACAIRVPVGSGKRRPLRVVVAKQVGETRLPSGYFNYTSPQIVAAMMQTAVEIPCTASFKIEIIGSNFVSVPAPLQIGLMRTACKTTIWISDTCAMCRSPVQSGVTRAHARALQRTWGRWTS